RNGAPDAAHAAGDESDFFRRTHLYFDLDVSTLHAHVEFYHTFRRRWADHGASFDIELCAVPRARHFFAFNIAFRQRPASVRAFVANREVIAVEIKKRDGFAVYLDLLRRSWGKLAGARNFDELCHKLTLSKISLLQGNVV
ncbi:MAG: hypothetical protein ACREBU_26755, partial [Nitrososphaera sp.]